jgi:predicted small metal-binding protein
MSPSYGWRDLRRCLLICGLVGSALVSINLGPQAFVSLPSGAAERARIALNFAVPFTVASASAILANRDRRPKTQQGQAPKPDDRGKAGGVGARPSPISGGPRIMRGDLAEGEGVTGIQAVKVNCDCGFMVGSHDEKEVADMSIMHVKAKHGKTISFADAKKLMKPM